MFLSIVHGRGETRIQRLEGKVKEDWGTLEDIIEGERESEAEKEEGERV